MSSQKNHYYAYDQIYFPQYPEPFFNIQDERDRKTRSQHAQIVKKIYQNNLKTLNIKLTEKKKIQYTPKNLKKINLHRNWYCLITDSQLNTQYTIFTIHGSPGNHIEWAGLQYQVNQRCPCRWINFIIPGYDGQDQRRGDYDGTPSHFCQLVISLLNKLNIKKVVLCGHSMGSIFGTYLLVKCPQFFLGYINVTGIVDQWYCGMMTFYNRAISTYGFNNPIWRQNYQHLLNNNDFRKKLRQQFIKNTNETFFGEVRFPQLTQSQLCAYIKLFNNVKQEFSIMYSYNKLLNIPRVLLFGRIDPLHESHKVQQSIINLCYGKNSYLNHPHNEYLIKLMKQQLQKVLKQKCNVQIPAQKVQQYFCYYFEETGHNAHKRRPKQIARIIEVYLVFLSIRQKYKNLINTKL